MKKRGLAAMAIGVVMMAAAGSARAEGYAEKAGPHEVGRLEAVWKDAKREREVPVLVCYPKDLAEAKEAAPVIVFSHGLGATMTTYEDYGRLWASYGYVVIFPQHHGSDTAGLVAGMLDGTRDDVKSFVDRAGDIHFVLDQVESMNAGKLDGTQYEAFKGKLDLTKIGMAGHSFGAITTDAIAGQTYMLAGKALTFGDKRIKAAIAMSPYPPFERRPDLDAAYASIKIPLFYLTGTQDTMGIAPAARRAGFDHSKVAGTALLVFKGGDHFTFAPLPLKPKTAKVGFQKIIKESTTAYWDAMLKGDDKAKAWLAGDLTKELGEMGTFERRE